MNATEEGQSKLDQLVNNEDINSIKYFSSKGNNEAQISYNNNTHKIMENYLKSFQIGTFNV